MEGVRKDARFSHITKDLRFRRMPKHEKKVKIDKRFKDMFTDQRFKLKYSVDKRGKPMNVTTNENLKQYYELSSSGDEDDEDDDEKESENEETARESEISKNKKLLKKETKSKIDKEKRDIETIFGKKTKAKRGDVKDKNTKKNKRIKSATSDSSDEDADEVVIKQNATKTKKSLGKEAVCDRKGKEVKGAKEEDSSDKEEEEEGDEDSDSDEDSGGGEGPDLARGEGNVETSSSSEDDDSEEEKDDHEEFDHGWGELDKDVPQAEELGRRLAMCNMDWDRIKAQDIFMLLHSFVPTGGSLRSVKVFPSEFGLQRMKEEALSGPTELVQSKSENMLDEENDEDDDDYDESQGTRYHREKLRQYQLNRLKYYYAVVETDSIETASKIYEECDGMEYESSSTKLDLRFIPDEMEFTEESKSECTEMPATYNPSLFVSTALAQSKVNLTWDETDQDRIKVTMRNPSEGKKKKTDDVNEEDFQAYLASSSDEEEGERHLGDLIEIHYGKTYLHVILLIFNDKYLFMTEDDRPVVSADDKEDDIEDDSEESQIKKYRSLLQSLDDDKNLKKKKDIKMEVTWEPGLKETMEKVVKHKEETKDQTPWQQYLRKKKEKRQMKREERGNRKTASNKETGDDQSAFSDDELPGDVGDDPFFRQKLDSDDEKDAGKKSKVSKNTRRKKRKDKALETGDPEKERELELLMMDEETDNRKHFSLKSIMKESKKRKKLSQEQKEKEFLINVEDDRFGAIFDSHLYNIDPSAPEFKKSRAMDAIIEEKMKRRMSGQTSKTVNASVGKRKADTDISKAGSSVKSKKLDSESISSLVNSIKSKTHTFHKKKKK
ncbi:ESF1 homolog isoform X1 [Ostrea edulis]|uniref:ESF1 homolog isoform X1 n=1 Tax=Ostrea edulis TaxID=37623 RepID=UPI0024AEE4DF|nr:ESF1 homolog isoform X1 [Ostrea edulis]XP_056022357.1 ESF1 homolog isoform X1 [Ostrea edulis]